MAPIPLMEGKYSLTINNPVFKDYTEKITISKKDTLNFNFNFAKSGEAFKSIIKTE
jgi:PEGA domain